MWTRQLADQFHLTAHLDVEHDPEFDWEDIDDDMVQDGADEQHNQDAMQEDPDDGTSNALILAQ